MCGVNRPSRPSHHRDLSADVKQSCSSGVLADPRCRSCGVFWVAVLNVIAGAFDSDAIEVVPSWKLHVGLDYKSLAIPYLVLSATV